MTSGIYCVPTFSEGGWEDGVFVAKPVVISPHKPHPPMREAPLTSQLAEAKFSRLKTLKEKFFG